MAVDVPEQPFDVALMASHREVAVHYVDSLPVAHRDRDSLPIVDGIGVRALYQVIAGRSLEQDAGDDFHDNSVEDTQRMADTEHVQLDMAPPL